MVSQHGSDSPCHHEIHWNTPEACPATKVKTSPDDCTIREPLYSHLFNLTSLHRRDSDYQLSHDGLTFFINPCGTLLHQNCSDPSKICLSKQLDITYDEDLRLDLESETSLCPSGEKVSAEVELLCHHSGGLGSPIVYTVEEGCRYLQLFRIITVPPLV